MDLHGLILHHVSKEQRETETDPQLREEEIPEDDLSISFVESIRDAYEQKRSYQYSTFGSNEDVDRFQGVMRDYLDDDDTFVNFSHRSISLLEDEMSDEVMATGGYVVFAHITNDDEKEYMLCLMVNDTEGFGVDDELGLMERVHLDIADLQIASRINIGDWRADKKGYVSFIPGQKRVSRYFKDFIGVEESSTGLQATRKADEAVKTYMEKHDYAPNKQEEVNELFVDYLDRAKKDEEAATIDAVANLVDPQNTDRFLEYATSDEYRVDATFAPTSKAIREIEEYEVSGDDFKVRFEKKLFRNQVEYEAEDEDLVIHQVTSDMLSEDLRRDLGIDE